MKANETNLTRFLSQPDTQFVIPVYQRNYDWTVTESKQLKDDILVTGSDVSSSGARRIFILLTTFGITDELFIKYALEKSMEND